MQRFSPAAQKGGVFADNVKKCILTPALTSSLVLEHGRSDEAEQGYLAGTFFSIGPLLLAFYFPQVFEAAEKRAQARKQTITQSVTESIGIPPVGLSLGVVDALAIPQFYRDLLVAAYNRFVEDETQASGGDYRSMANMLATAARLADAIVDTSTKSEFKKQLEAISAVSGLSLSQIDLVLKQTPESFKQHAKMIEMSFLSLPEHFVQYLQSDGKPDSDEEVGEDSVGDDFSFYLDEIRQAIANRETMSSIITTAMEALAFGQKFDRVLLLYLDDSEQTLIGKMTLGEPFGTDPKSIQRDLEFLDVDNAPDVKAMVDGTVEVFGDPLFPSGWPFAVIPVGNPDNVVGVIYADMINSDQANAKPLDSGVKMALNLLADLLEQAVTLNIG
jgi:hypothetical protein